MYQKLNMLKQLMAALVLVAAIGGLGSCEKYTYMPEVVNPITPVYFQADIQPIFNAKCITCHTSIRNPDLMDGKSYESLTTGGFVNQPGETSILYLQMTTNSAHIPRSSDKEKSLVLNWINQGALNN
jgi:hypothetical protein